MNSEKEKLLEEIKSELDQLKKLFKNTKHLLIVVHTNPDPDAIASAAALQHLVKGLLKVEASIAYSGNVGRAENREMLKKLKIHMKQIKRINFDKYDRIALVDTQVGAGNHPLPDKTGCDLVIDHHPIRNKGKAKLEIIKPEIGVTSTMLIEYIRESDLDFPVNLATALAYAISSETQNLGREASKRDIEAYFTVFVNSSMKKLSQILHPKLTRAYYVSLAKALQEAEFYRNIICSHIGEVPAAEIVSEMADFLLRLVRVSWALCTGRFKGQLIISVRATQPNAKAGTLVQSLVNDPDTVGGHDMMAGGYIPLNDGKKQEYKEVELQLSREFAKIQGYDAVEWKPLLQSLELPKKGKV